MNRNLQISIPEPCHENWNLMTPEEKGRFCGACQKTVFDFTKSTDREIIQTFNTESKLCGRFLNSQLNRELAIPKERKSIWLASTFFGLLTFSSLKSYSQEKPKVEQTDIKHELQGKIAVSRDTIRNKTITGIVSDSSGPLPGVNVVIKGETIGVSTGFDGKYSINVNEGDELVFSFMGMQDEVRKVADSNYINVALKDHMMGMLGDVILVKKTNFFKRQYYRVRNLFR